MHSFSKFRYYVSSVLYVQLCGFVVQEWASHTGRYRGQGIDEPDYVTWKTRLRCALNKAPDIQEVKAECQTEDNANAFRVFEFLKKTSMKNCVVLLKVLQNVHRCLFIFHCLSFFC